MKKLLTISLFGIAIAGVIFAAVKSSRPQGTTQSVATPTVVIPEDGVVVTYFTTNVRCSSCRKIEALTRETIAGEFPDECADGKVVFQVLNTDFPENAHFIEEYKLVSKTVVVSERNAGKETGWKNLQDIWLKLKDPADFKNYVAAGVREYVLSAKK